jgi:nuclear pore complex protein Nup210
MTGRPPDNDASVMDWWHRVKQDMPILLQKGLASTTLLIPWMTWKHRNDCVFEGAQSSIRSLVTNIKEGVRLWAQAGAQGLGVVLPPTWDVH